MEVSDFHGSDLMYMFISSRIFVARSCGGGLRLRAGLFLFVQ